MTAQAKPKVVNLRPDQGPPATDFEREAVGVLLGHIRSFRSKAGMEPDALVIVTLGEDDEQVYHHHGWMCPDGRTLHHLAYAGALLTSKAILP